MKLVVSFLLILISAKLFAQNNFTKELESIIKDSTFCFKSLRGDFKELQGTDSIFNSIIKLEGTNNNDILLSETICMYMGVIADSVKEKQGEKIVDLWRNKIYSLVSGSFRMEEIKIVKWNPAKHGWKFERRNLWIDITLYPFKNKTSSLCFVGFSVTYLKDASKAE